MDPIARSFRKAHAMSLLAECSEARLAILQSPSWGMRPVEEWPEKEQDKFLGKHVGYADRCSLLYFLAVNQCDPGLLPKWAAAQKGWLRRYKSAEHMCKLVESWRVGAFENTTFREALSLETERKVPVFTPHFARDTAPIRVAKYDGDWLNGPIEKTGYFYMPAGATHWEEAKRDLMQFAHTLPH